MHERKRGVLHSGSDKGPKVTSRAQAIAIGLSEQRRAKSKQDSMILGTRRADNNPAVPVGELRNNLRFSDPEAQSLRRGGGMGHDFDRI